MRRSFFRYLQQHLTVDQQKRLSGVGWYFRLYFENKEHDRMEDKYIEEERKRNRKWDKKKEKKKE